MMSVQDLLALAKASASTRVVYGSNESQFLDLYLPENKTFAPIVLLLHGGCWRSRVSLDYFGQAAKALSHLGLAVINIEYRRLGNGGGYPETFLDVAKAADFVRTIAQDYSLDASRVVAVGHSAGGHLVHWLAAREKLSPNSELYSKNPLKVKGFISLAGIPDLTEAVRRDICDDAAPVQLMGGTPSEQAKRYQQGSPAQLAPLPLNCKQVFIHGKQDDTVPHDYVESYVKQANTRAETVQLISLEDTGHYDLVVASTAQWQVVEKQIKAILEF